MNDLQFFQQLEFITANALWPDTNNRVFPTGSVLVTAALEEKALQLLRHPWVLFRVGTCDGDPEHGQEGGLVKQVVEAVLAVRVPGHALARGAIMGANRQVNTSKGAGILVVQVPLLKAIRQLGPQHGIDIGSFFKGAVAIKKIKDREYELQRGYRFEAWTSEDEIYPGPTGFTATVAAPNISLAWTSPGARFDYIGVHVRRLSGVTPPAHIGEGTSVYQGVLTAHSDAPGSGTWSYSIFGEYDVDADAVADRYSTPVAQTRKVIP